MDTFISPSISITDLTLKFRQNDKVIFSHLNLLLQGGKWTCVVGRSGCGKTTLLRLLANLLDDVEWQGAITASDNLVIDQRIAYMAQQDLLLPWLTVLDNACLSEKFATTKVNHGLKNKAIDLLKQVGLGGAIYHRPDALSGGMRQRVALVRTLLQNKPIVLMDEPFSALDAVTRYQLQTLAAEMLKDKTVLFITHDPQEALRLADNLLMMYGSKKNMTVLPLPDPLPPRKITAALALYQQQIIDALESDNECA